MARAVYDESFNSNRAVGSVAVEVAAENGITRRRRVSESGSIRVRFPNSAGDSLEAVFINTAGGMAGGDRFSIDLDVGPKAKLIASTAAAEKIYRSIGPDTEFSVCAEIGAGGRLVWLPQETILFDRAQLNRRVDIRMASGSSVLFCECVTFGRSAMGETVHQGKLIDRWRVSRGGRLLFADTLRFDGAIRDKLAKKASASGAIALATLLIVPGDDSIATSVRELSDRFAGEVGISVWNGLALARFCARDNASLRNDLMFVVAALGLSPLPRLWLS